MQSNRAPSTPETSRFRGDIQGLRATAVLAVVLYHAGVPFLTGGYVGVDVFFVISGFLITSHLLTSLRRDGKVHFASFYAKRARRILPASFVVLSLSVIAALIWYPPLLMREVWTGAVATAFYVPNILFAADGTNYLAETTPSLFQHYWSLGIEEQFYLLWPLLLTLGFLRVKRPRVLLALLAGLVALSFATCVVLTFQQQPWAFFLLPTRAWELGVGGLVAFLLSYRPDAVRGIPAAVISWAGVAGILASVLFFTSSTPFPGYWAAVPVLATAAVIAGGSTRPAHGPFTALSTRPMIFVGLISYSLYLVHWPLLMIAHAILGFQNEMPLVLSLTLSATSFAIAWFLFRYVEEPGRKGAWLANARPRRALLTAGAASVAAALLATGVYAVNGVRPLDAGLPATATVITNPPDFTSFVPSNLTPPLSAASSDQPVIYDDGCHADFAVTAPEECVFGDPTDPRIVLFGDSHAAQWFPALEKYALSNGYSLESHTKSSCPSIDAVVLRDDVPYTQCTTWRDAVIDRVKAEDPAMVVLANFGVARLQGVDEAGYSQAWGSALGSTVERVDAPTTLIADTPILSGTPSICLSANLDDTFACGRAASEALDQPARAAEEDFAATTGIPRIDLTDVICDEKCEPLIGNTLVYRDAHHLTASFSQLLAGELGRRMGPILATVTAR